MESQSWEEAAAPVCASTAAYKWEEPSPLSSWGSSPAVAANTRDEAGPWAPQKRQSSDWTEEDETRANVENRGLAPGPYRRGSVLGRGGLGDVYKVLRLADGRVFAGKTSEKIQQMRQEARLLRSLTHEHILAYVDWYEEENHPPATLLVTELCAGGTLQTRINNASQGMSAIDTLRVIQQIASALSYLHGQGLSHTDVKPHNILLRRTDPITAVLADCADARAPATSSRSRSPRKALGTHKYWSPETAARGRHAAGPGDDVWALGLTALGMAAQWPRMAAYTKQGLREYPRRCAEHARVLVGLNPGHGVVALLGGMLALDVGERVAARECERTAGEMLGWMEGGQEERWRREGGMGIKAPEDFQAISFW